AGQAARAAHDGNAFPLAIGCLPRSRDIADIKLDVIADEQVKESVAVVVKPSASCAPADPVLPEPCPFRHVGERAIAVVVPQNVVAPSRYKTSRPSHHCCNQPTQTPVPHPVTPSRDLSVT